MPVSPNTPHRTAAASCGFHSSISPACSRNSTSRGTTLGNGMSRQRQNLGAVGQVTRAMVVLSPSCLMVMRCRSWLGQRRLATPAIVLAREQAAMAFGGSWIARTQTRRVMRSVSFCDVGPAQRGDGNFLVRAVNRHRLERRFLGQRVHHRARETPRVFVVAHGASGGWPIHLIICNTSSAVRRWQNHP